MLGAKAFGHWRCLVRKRAWRRGATIIEMLESGDLEEIMVRR
jgi:hypothetical protein